MAGRVCKALNPSSMDAGPNDQPGANPRRRYVWPWFVLGALILAVVLAILWMSQEIARTKRIRDANSPNAPMRP
jgi:hypothetical protein